MLFVLALCSSLCLGARVYERNDGMDTTVGDGLTPPGQMLPFNSAEMIAACDANPACNCFNSHGWQRTVCSPLIPTPMGGASLYTLVPTPQPATNKGLSGGSVFLIILFAVVGAYMLGGIAYKMKVKGTRGTESIPHIDCWRRVADLVSGGCYFTKTKIQAMMNREESYQSIVAKTESTAA